jgi:hypothetical protein
MMPSSRRISPVVTVVIRCKRNVDGTFRPVIVKSDPPGVKSMSVSLKSEIRLLVMKATRMCLCEPKGSVKQTAGLTFAPLKSSNGNGMRTTFPLTIERSAICEAIDVFV